MKNKHRYQSHGETKFMPKLMSRQHYKCYLKSHLRFFRQYQKFVNSKPLTKQLLRYSIKIHIAQTQYQHRPFANTNFQVTKTHLPYSFTSINRAANSSSTKRKYKNMVNLHNGNEFAQYINRKVRSDINRKVRWKISKEDFDNTTFKKIRVQLLKTCMC